MRLAIFGGTFDPPHIGHLLAASDAMDALQLTRLVFVPNAEQPIKGPGEVSARHRLAMVRLLAGDDPRFEVDPIEIDRAGLSYMVDTLTAYAARHPSAERFLLVGADVLSSLGSWREPDRIVALARIAVLERVSPPKGAEDGWETPRLATANSGGTGATGTALRVPTRRVDVSSTEIRARVRAGKSIHGFVPDAVAADIAQQRLYQ